jgi:hypothetical protein
MDGWMDDPAFNTHSYQRLWMHDSTFFIHSIFKMKKLK